jgi:hypothetical protein
VEGGPGRVVRGEVVNIEIPSAMGITNLKEINMYLFKLFCACLVVFMLKGNLYAGPREEYYGRDAGVDKLSTVYYPSPTATSNTYYLNGIPFSANNGDSTYFVMAMETDKVAGKPYMRLWLLYQNKTNSPYLLEPLKILKLLIHAKDKIHNQIPTSPSEILSRINSEKLSIQILQVIGGALQTVSTSMNPEATITDPSGGVYKINDENVGGKIGARTAANMQSTAYMYEAYKNSINNVILRRNTVFKDKNIMGYVYFDISGINLKKATKLDLFINTQDGIQLIEFTPQEGE